MLANQPQELFGDCTDRATVAADVGKHDAPQHTVIARRQVMIGAVSTVRQKHLTGRSQTVVAILTLSLGALGVATAPASLALTLAAACGSARYVAHSSAPHGWRPRRQFTDGVRV